MKSTFKQLTSYVILARVFIALPLGTATSAVLAQTNVGRISGTVTDTSGAAIQSVTIRIRDDATGLSRTRVATTARLTM